jgi:hypothetical protein
MAVTWPHTNPAAHGPALERTVVTVVSVSVVSVSGGIVAVGMVAVGGGTGLVVGLVWVRCTGVVVLTVPTGLVLAVVAGAGVVVELEVELEPEAAFCPPQAASETESKSARDEKNRTRLPG